jgi:hypothetical protein
MRYRVDTNELWTMAATAQDTADGLGEAFAVLARVADAGIDSWCAHPDAASATMTAVAAVEEQLRAAQTCAAGLGRQLATAAQAYADVDTLRPR